MKKTLHVIIVEDSENDAKLLIRELTRGGYDVKAQRVETEQQLRDALENGKCDVVLSDFSLPRFGGEAALRILRSSGRDVPFIFVSGTMGEEIAVGAMKAGAHDYVMKGNLARLVVAIERELRDAEDRQRHRDAETQVRMSEHKYRHLFRRMSDAALLIALETDRVIDVNEQAETLFGRGRDDLLGTASAQLFPESNRKQWTDAPGAGPAPEEFESGVKRANGSIVPVHVSVSRIELYDRPFRLALFRDISERKRNEAALRSVLRHARTFVAEALVNAPGNWRSDPVDTALSWEWRFPDVASAEEVLPLETPAGKAYADSWGHVTRAHAARAIGASAVSAFTSGSDSWLLEFRCVDRNGAPRVFTQAASVETLAPNQWRVTTINTDITDRVLAEEALRTSEERLATVFKFSPTAICIVRKSDQRIVDANESFIQGTGYRREELIHHTPEERQLWADPVERATIVGEVEKRGAAVAFKIHGRRRTGEVGVGLGSVAKISLKGEDHLVWMIQDITELDRAEEARRESDRRFRQVAENIDEVFWLTDLEKRQMIYVSPAYACIWGRPCETVYAQPMSWLDAVRAEDRERVRTALPLQANGEYDIEYRIVRPDGSVRWIHERAFPVKDEHGATYRVAGVASDITVRRELEEQFRQSQKMEAVGQLAGGIAHDFNNLLTVIQLQSSLILDRVGTDREAEQGIRQVIDAASRASNLTRQLLTFSRRQTQTARDTDLGEVVGSMSKMLRRILGEDIVLENRFAPSLPLVHVDPGMMEQVLMNLVVNARDAMPDGGRLQIALDALTLDPTYVATQTTATTQRFVCLSVTDTGTGIPPEIRSRIFEPFFTTKEVGKGTGLGLATVFGIVKQHRGWIEVDSEVGRGTEFRVYLPALPRKAGGSNAPQNVAEPPGGSETILLVEDEASVRALARSALVQRGYRVLEAEKASEALQRWDEAQGKIDLLLTDLIMPGGVSGKELAAQLLQRAPKLRTIYTTGHSPDLLVSQLQLKVGYNYLPKPYSFFDLAQIVRKRLDEAKG